MLLYLPINVKIFFEPRKSGVIILLFVPHLFLIKYLTVSSICLECKFVLDFATILKSHVPQQ